MFRPLIRLSLLLFALTAGACSSASYTLPMPEIQEEIQYEPVKPQEWKLANGLTVVYAEDNELPIVRGALYIPRGTLWEKSGEKEFLSAMGYLLRNGGTRRLDPDQLDLRLERLAAGIESDYSAEFGTAAFSCLNTDFENVFSLFSDVVLEPRFDQSRLDLWKGQMLEGIRRRSDDPSSIAAVALKKLLYGDTVFGRVATSSDIKRIRRDDLFRMHKHFVHPNNAYLVVTGDIDRARLEKVVDEYFARWQPSAAELNDQPEFDYQPVPGVYYIKQPFEQSTIYAAEHGPARLPKDYTAIEAFNNIFGSGDFGARLFRRIRTELGLAYALYGATIPSFTVGQNIIVIQTKGESAATAAVESLKIVKELQEADAEKAELTLAQQAIKNSFIFKIDTTDEAVKRHVLLKMLDYPEDYDRTFIDKVNTLELEDIKEVANKYWDLSKMVIVVVGNEKAYNAFQEKLQSDPIFFNSIKTCKFEEDLSGCS